MSPNWKSSKAFSLIEVLITISIVGVITAAAIPVVSNIHESSTKAKNLANAKHIERMSASLASLGVAHVIPDSMGGVEATARLLREGVKVPEGPMAGETFQLNGMSDNDISAVGELLRVQYDMRELRLVMEKSPTTLLHWPPSTHMLCFDLYRPPCRIEKVQLS
ncbi:MAG: type II secretion system protein [Verrucomicrobiales bacterium]|nr:type II secretion system protein [Verrucomicrobiales bacterium]